VVPLLCLFYLTNIPYTHVTRFWGGFCRMHVVVFADDGMSRREMGKKGIYRLVYEV
jgi:hypothetical protein